MDGKEARAIAAFLREALKQDTEAITIVMTRDTIESLYKVAKIAVTIIDMMKEDEK